jgi:UPF0716 protein FxsA
MPLLLLALFIALPILELYVIIQVGGSIGVLPTLALLILDSILGTILFRSQGRAAWERFNRALAEGRIPGREVFDGAMVILGGALLITPGFITDVFGLICLIPPTRALVRRLLGGLARRRMTVGWRYAGEWQPPRPGQNGRNNPPPGPGWRPGPDYDYEGTATEVPEQPRELPGEDPERG